MDSLATKLLEYTSENRMIMISIVEILATLVGSVYIITIQNPPRSHKLFVFYLWLVLFGETVGLYPLIAYLSDYEYFGWTKDTLIERNFWFFNIIHFFQTLVLLYFFWSQLRQEKNKSNLKIIVIIYTISIIVGTLITRQFFHSFSSFVYVGSTFSLLFAIGYYLKELLASKDILFFQFNLSFYVAILILLFSLTMTPLFIYSTYFNSGNPYFVELYNKILLAGNIVLYPGYMLGFFMEWQGNRLGIKRKNS